MADDNMKDFVVNWFIVGFLLFGLLSTAITFIYYNNPGGLGDTGDVLEGTLSSIQSNLVALPNSTDALLNITSNTNPELSQLGSRDSVATAYGSVGTSKGFFTSTKILIAWVFTGTSGEILLFFFGGIFSFVAVYYIIKWVRNGI